MTALETLSCGASLAVVACLPAPYRDGDPGEDGALLARLGDDGDGAELVFAVADGAGGQRGGERASEIALQTLRESLFERDGAVRERILHAFEVAHARIQALALGAATTLAVAHIQGSRLATYHVGDSTVLLVGQRGRRKHLTVWHSPAGYEMAAGTIDAAGAADHEEAHLVLHLLGMDSLKVEMSSGVDISARDTLVLGSDGLFDNVTVDEVAEMVRKGPIDRCARSLLDRARERMRGDRSGPSKPDDLTFVLWRRKARRGSPS